MRARLIEKALQPEIRTRFRQGTERVRRRRRAVDEDVFRTEDRAGRERYRPSEPSIEFPDIAGPGVQLESPQTFFRNLARPLPPGVDVLEKGERQLGDLTGPLAKGRYL